MEEDLVSFREELVQDAAHLIERQVWTDSDIPAAEEHQALAWKEVKLRSMPRFQNAVEYCWAMILARASMQLSLHTLGQLFIKPDPNTGFISALYYYLLPLKEIDSACACRDYWVTVQGCAT